MSLGVQKLQESWRNLHDTAESENDANRVIAGDYRTSRALFATYCFSDFVATSNSCNLAATCKVAPN